MMILPFIRMGEWIFFVSEPLPFSADKLATMLSSDFFGSVSALGMCPHDLLVVVVVFSSALVLTARSSSQAGASCGASWRGGSSRCS